MNINLCVALLVVAFAAPSWAVTKTADSDYLKKEKSILQLLVHVHQPLMYPQLIEIAKTYSMKNNIDMYKDRTAVREFLKRWDRKEIMERGDIFSAMDDEHLKQAVLVFDLMFFAKDWDTFYKTAVWLRQNVNEGMFVYTFAIAMRHREDTRNLIIPAFYEIVPHLYIRSEVMQKVYEARMKSVDKADKDVILIHSNLSQWMHTYMSPEMRMTHLTEDVTAGQCNLDLHIEAPWWFTNDRYDWKIQRHGEFLFYYQNQLLHKYTMDRLTNGLPEYDRFSWNDRSLVGYAPHLRYKNGMEMPARPDNIWLMDTESLTIDAVKDMERRINSAIETGYFVNKEGKIVNLLHKDAVESIGRIINNNMEGVSANAFGALARKMISLIGRIVDPYKKLSLAPSSLMHYETQLRDPAYYSIVSKVHDIFRKQKMMLPPYEKEELNFQGVMIKTFDIDKLITFFEPFDTEVNNAVDVRSLDDDRKMSIYVRHSRINHMPFSYRLNIESEKATSAIVRFFMGPKTDGNGIELSLKEKAHHMGELDRFVVDLVPGTNQIERSADDFRLFKKEKTSFKGLLKKVEDALQGKAAFQYEEEILKIHYPAHHIIPKGRKYGMPYSMFAIVSPIQSNSMGRIDALLDDRPLGYPFDRKVDLDEFMMPNMMEKEVVIYHKKTDEKFESF